MKNNEEISLGERWPMWRWGPVILLCFCMAIPLPPISGVNVLPYLQGQGRCLAPDLIGMGDSEKLPQSGLDSYSFVEHRRYLDALLETLGVNERVVLVLHDWGSALGFDWANRHREAVKGITYMEAIVQPVRWEDWSAGSRAFH